MVSPLMGLMAASPSTVSPKSSMRKRVFFGGRPDFNGVAAHAKPSTFKGDVVALILDIDQFQQQRFTLDRLAVGEEDHHAACNRWASRDHKCTKRWPR